MPAADELDVDGVPGGRVAAAQLDRHRLVGVAVHEQHLDRGRLVDRRGRALRDERAGWRRRTRPSRAASGRSLTGACASTPRTRKRLAASIARCPPALWPASATRSRSISSGSASAAASDVLQRHRPVAVAVEPAVLHVPDRQAARGEVGRHAVLQVAPVLLAPAAAVHEHHARVRPGALGQPQLGYLLGVRAVADRGRGLGARHLPGSSSRSASAARQQSW